MKLGFFWGFVIDLWVLYSRRWRWGRNRGRKLCSRTAPRNRIWTDRSIEIKLFLTELNQIIAYAVGSINCGSQGEDNLHDKHPKMVTISVERYPIKNWTKLASWTNQFLIKKVKKAYMKVNRRLSMTCWEGVNIIVKYSNVYEIFDQWNGVWLIKSIVNWVCAAQLEFIVKLRMLI